MVWTNKLIKWEKENPKISKWLKLLRKKQNNI